GLTARQLWDAVGPAVQQLAPAIWQVVSAFSPLGLIFKVLAPVLPVLAKSLGDVVTALSGALAGAAPALAAVATALAGIVAGAVQLIAPLLASEGLVKGLVFAFLAWRTASAVATAAQWALNAAMSANPIGLIIAGIAALVAGLVWFFTQTEVGQKIVKSVWGGIQTAIGATVDWFQGTAWPAMKAVWDGIVNVAKVAWTVLKVVFVAIATGFALAWKVVTTVWKVTGKPIFDAMVGVAKWLGERIAATWANISRAIGVAWSWINRNVIIPFRIGVAVLGAVFRTLWKAYVVPAFNGIKNALGAAWNWIKRTIFDAWNRALTSLGRAWQWLNTKVIQPAWRGIRTAASTAWNWIRTNVFTPFGRAYDAIGNAFLKVGDGIGKAWWKIKEAAAKPVNFVIETVYMKGIKGTWDKIAGSVGLDLKLPTVNPIRFANGSEDHRAQIARPGAMRLWAEPETGGEAYIPLAKSKRGRSTAILGAVARKFGYSLNKYADGGITGAIGDIGKKVLDILADPGSLFKGALDKLKGFGGGAVGKIAGALPGKIIDAIIDKAKSFGGGGQDVALSGGGRFAGGPVMGWQNMWNIVKNAFPGATLNSAY